MISFRIFQDPESFAEDRGLFVDDPEISCRVPQVAGDQRPDQQEHLFARPFEHGIVGLYLLFLSHFSQPEEVFVRKGKVVDIIIHVGVFPQGLFAVIILPRQDKVGHHPLADHFTQIFGVARGIRRHEDVGHDASTPVYHTMVLQGIVFQRVGQVDAVGIHELTVLVPLLQVFHIVVIAAFVRFLDKASRRGEIAGDGQTHHAVVGQVERFLHQSFAESTSSHDQSPVPVLHRPGKDLTCRGSTFVHQHHQAHLLQASSVGGKEVLPFQMGTLHVHDELFGGHELIHQVGGCREHPSAVIAQVEDKTVHPVQRHAVEGFVELIHGLGRETVDLDVSDVFFRHIGSIQAEDRDLVARDGEMQQPRHIPLQDVHVHLRPCRPHQFFPHGRRGDAYAADVLAVDAHDAVAGTQACFLGGSSADG